MQIVGATWPVYQLSHSATAVGLLAALARGRPLIGSLDRWRACGIDSIPAALR